MIYNMPTKDFAQYIQDLAKKHGVKYIRTGNDALAEVITRLSDDDIDFDNTENTIVALKRAGIIDGKEMVKLLGGYLNEKKR